MSKDTEGLAKVTITKSDMQVLVRFERGCMERTEGAPDNKARQEALARFFDEVLSSSYADQLLAAIERFEGLASTPARLEALKALLDEAIANEGEPKAYIKASLHAEKQKFGRKKQQQQSLFDGLPEDVTEEAAQANLTVIGIDNTQAQNKALHAVQKLLTETGYKGNAPAETGFREHNNAFFFEGEAPRLRVTVPQYLDAFGVGKSLSARGKQEYHRGERDEALKALKALHDKRYLILYEKLVGYDKKKPVFQAVRTMKPLIEIWEGYEHLSQRELQRLKAGDEALDKLTHLGITASVLLVDQIDTYFLMKPATLYQEIQLTFGRVDKKLPLFIEYLIAEAAQRTRKGEGLTFERKLETVTYALRLDYLVDSRQRKRLRKQLITLMEQTKRLGYLEAFEITTATTGEEQARFVLCEEKFYRTQAQREAAAAGEEEGK